MPKFLDTSGKPTLGIAICDRCSRKFPIDQLYSDPNTPGLKVCVDDIDDYDPYRLPARRTEDITLPFYRPDEPLTDLAEGEVSPEFGLFGVIVAISSVNPRIDSDGNIRVMEDPYENIFDPFET